MARTSPALRGFVHAFSLSNSRITPAIIPSFLAPTIAQECMVPGTPRLNNRPSRRHASVTPSQYSTKNRADSHIYSKHAVPREVKHLVSPSRRLEPAAWATTIESFLPLNLRLGAENVTEGVIQHEVLRPICTLPEVLSMARSYCKADILSYIGVYQERWEAVLWLIKAMMEEYPGHRELERRASQLPTLPWPHLSQSLDEVTANAIQIDMPQPTDISPEHTGSYDRSPLDSYTWLRSSYHWDDPNFLGRKCLGQVWQSLGTMILQAADRSAEDDSYSVVMSHVFQILGHLHRINAFPDSIYNFAPPTDPTVIQRPPTLYLLSRRIMSTLSDVEFGLQWQETTTKAMSQGYELPKASVQPKLREFGPELWLDLILWACVEGGWVSEGVWIVIEMERRKESKETRWSTISWQEICEVKAPKLDWTSILRLEIDKTRLNQVGGIGIATGTNSHVEMGTRTVSREVVLALIDGLFNDPQSTPGGPPMSIPELQQSIIACTTLLDRKHPKLDSKFMEAAILRVFESTEKVKEQPGSLERFLSLRPTDPKKVTGNARSKSSTHDQEIENHAAVLGLHHRNLRQFSMDGNLQGSLQTFKRIQSTIDAQHEAKIWAFADELRERLGKGDDVSDLIGDEEDYVALTQPPKIPPSALAPFIDLITDCRLFGLGNWLLLNEDIDGGLMDPALYSDQNLQPALLRFGTAASDPRLLRRILEGLVTPLAEPVVHALLRFQVSLGKWTAVEELLEYLKMTPDMAWTASDATAIATAVLYMEHEPSDSANADSVPRALALIQNLVNGKYNTKADPWQLSPDFSQIKMASQLGRIFRTLPGSLRKITTRLAGEDRRAYGSAEVAPHAFEIIVEAMVDCYGSLAAKKLWNQWCHRPDYLKREQQLGLRFGDAQRVVTPSLHMLRSILRPVLETRRHLRAAMKQPSIDSRTSKTPTSHQADKPSIVAAEEEFQHGDGGRKIVDWGISTYKWFGLTNSEINDEIPDSFPQSRKGKPVRAGNGEDGQAGGI